MLADATTTPSAPRALDAIKSIVVATDLSARSDRAVARAVRLARAHKARLTVVSIIDEDLPTAAQERLGDLAKDEIERFLEAEGARDIAGLEVKIAVGVPYREIVRQAEAADADLLVLGVHRNEAPDSRVTGTTMERALRRGAIPVLVVSKPAEADYRRPLAAVDFSVFSRAAIAGARALAPDREVGLIHAFQVPFAGFMHSDETRDAVRAEHERGMEAVVSEEIDRLLAASEGEADKNLFQPIVRQGPVGEVVRDQCAQSRSDLLVIGTHGRAGFARALLGSVAEDFLNRPPCDVLVVKAW